MSNVLETSLFVFNFMYNVYTIYTLYVTSSSFRQFKVLFQQIVPTRLKICCRKATKQALFMIYRCLLELLIAQTNRLLDSFVLFTPWTLD